MDRSFPQSDYLNNSDLFRIVNAQRITSLLIKMSSPNQLIAPLPYFTDSAELFSVYADKAWAVFLDSGFPHSNQGRYDIIAAEPVCTLVTHGEITEITCNGVTIKSTENPFDLVKQQLAQFPGF